MDLPSQPQAIHAPFMKVLFITSTRIGDAVLSTGLLNHLLQQRQAQVTVACGQPCASLFEGFEGVERIIPMVKRKHHGHWRDLWKSCVRTRWSLVVDLRNSAVSRLIWADRRYILGRGIDRQRHKVEQLASIMGLSPPPPPQLQYSEKQRTTAAQLIGDGPPVLAVGPAANWIGKTWPVDRFIDLIAWLRQPEGLMAGWRVAVFAAPGEVELAQPVLDALPAVCTIDMIGKVNPGEAAAALARCQLYIGNDSGLMHCAAASAVPTFGLFGPSHPHIYRPWGESSGFAQTPESFQQLIDFEGYHPATLQHSLMNSLELEQVKRELATFCQRVGVSD
jgi:heptosyltransferase-3